MSRSRLAGALRDVTYSSCHTESCKCDCLYFNLLLIVRFLVTTTFCFPDGNSFTNMTTFVTVLHRDLASKITLPAAPSRPGTPALLPTSTDNLRAYYLQLNPPTSLEDAGKCVDTYQVFQEKYASVQVNSEEEEFLQAAILAKLVVGLYVQTLELCLDEATDVETELNWWADVERSRRSSAYYLLQSELLLCVCHICAKGSV